MTCGIWRFNEEIHDLRRQPPDAGLPPLQASNPGWAVLLSRPTRLHPLLLYSSSDASSYASSVQKAAPLLPRPAALTLRTRPRGSFPEECRPSGAVGISEVGFPPCQFCLLVENLCVSLLSTDFAGTGRERWRVVRTEDGASGAGNGARSIHFVASGCFAGCWSAARHAFQSLRPGPRSHALSATASMRPASARHCTPSSLRVRPCRPGQVQLLYPFTLPTPLTTRPICEAGCESWGNTNPRQIFTPTKQRSSDSPTATGDVVSLEEMRALRMQNLASMAAVLMHGNLPVRAIPDSAPSRVPALRAAKHEMLPNAFQHYRSALLLSPPSRGVSAVLSPRAFLCASPGLAAPISHGNDRVTLARWLSTGVPRS